MVYIDDHYITSKAGQKITHTTPFNLNKLLNDIKTWYLYMKYDFTEREHTIKDLPRGKEVEIKWLLSRNIDDYVQYHIDIHILIFDMVKVKSGNQVLDIGDFLISFTAYLVFDYNKKLHSRFGKLLKYVYNNYIIKDRLDDYEDKLIDELKNIKKLVKESLEFYD